MPTASHGNIHAVDRLFSSREMFFDARKRQQAEVTARQYSIGCQCDGEHNVTVILYDCNIVMKKQRCGVSVEIPITLLSRILLYTSVCVPKYGKRRVNSRNKICYQNPNGQQVS